MIHDHLEVLNEFLYFTFRNRLEIPLTGPLVLRSVCVIGSCPVREFLIYATIGLIIAER